jgi:hypothetical protein
VDITEKIRGGTIGASNVGTLPDMGCYEQTCNATGGPYYVNDATSPLESGSLTSAVGTSSGTGSISSPFLTLKQAIDACGCGGTTIYVDKGTYTDDNLTLSTVATEGSPLIIQGAGKTSTIFDCNADNVTGERFMTISTDATYVTISDITIQDADVAGNGAGINITTTGRVTLQDIIFSNCDISGSGNPSTYAGGGVYIGSSTTTTVDRCIFTGCDEFTSYSKGAAIYVNAGSGKTNTIQNSLFYANTVKNDYSGVLYSGISSGTVTTNIINSTFSKNTSTSSTGTGAIYSDYDGGLTTNIINSIIYGNTSFSKGVYNYNGTGTLNLTNSLYESQQQADATTNSLNNQDPLFTNSTTNDLSITAVSPARNKVFL